MYINSLQTCPFSFHCRAGLYYLEMQYHALSDRLMIVADQASIMDGHPCLPSEGQIFTPLQNTKIVGILISHFFYQR